MNILLTIGARGGSKGVKNKNIRDLCGKPLIAYSIEQAIKWGKADKIVVTTDSDDIARIARQYGADTPFKRPAESATDIAPKVPAIRHALIEAEKFYKMTFDIIVDLDATAPVRTINDLNACLELFLSKRPKSLFSVVNAQRSPYFNMVELDSNGFASLSKKPIKPVFRRQDAPIVYSLNASIYFYSREYLINPETNSAISDQSIIYPMDELSSIDIDREMDFKFVEFLIKEKVWIPSI